MAELKDIGTSASASARERVGAAVLLRTGASGRRPSRADSNYALRCLIETTLLFGFIISSSISAQDCIICRRSGRRAEWS